MQLVASPTDQGLTGSLQMPGDKSISHRSLMFAAIADGDSEVHGVLEGEDCQATAAAMRAMGAGIERVAPGHYRVSGVGLRGLKAPAAPLDMGNSGTGMRLLTGLLAAQPFASELTGDASLSSRPMRRVTDPLCAMGARINTVDGHAPLSIGASEGLVAIDYDMPVASAQLKSALLIAGLYAKGTTSVLEPAPSRDHTERMLAGMGAKIQRENMRVSIDSTTSLRPLNLQVPADLSSAAFFLVAASIVPGSDLLLPGVGINETRRGVLTILEAMGANIELQNQREAYGEVVADIRVRYAQLQGASFSADVVPLAIDEFPVLFVAAAAAQGETYFEGLEELRHKESDRIEAMVIGLRTLGIHVEAGADWVRIRGGQFTGGRVDSFHDHRIAMAFAVAGALSQGTVHIDRPENIATSFPNFIELAQRCGMRLSLEPVA